ncbi:putative integral membrane protein [Actinoplanes missouriensis 431]|uniref:Putative integral membrane protein n=1 Tax=Actinoplanes missouriensis (strain ATCC 14538 / DSM 43046 / CBS 188.64 / JCM 3121 / NBRC 102363 / NCIMB 12654 / NRRL B-3342 / UNCC 431) TaxID=512565 RepID=I0GZ05_ACTM4|nr:Bax inhibitor-1/YccA family protein [Actinoplanes missouriensis]BAL85992.1 putative integral membrane protein [Actinoplanes missouriensis 431]
MKTSNPVLSRLGQAAERERAAGYGQAPGQPGYGQPGYGQPAYGEPYPTATGYPASPPAVRPMTVDDVVVKTVTLLGITGISAVAAWNLIPASATGAAWIGAALVGLVLGLVISFMRVANPALVVTYAVVEGVFVGMVSKFFENIMGYEGIVLQAVVATFGVFFLMAVLYRARVIRATPKFTRALVSIMAGLFAVMLINFVLALFDVNTGLRDNGPVGYIFSLVCIVVASLSFILSFNEVEEGVRMGLPQRYSWTAAFGILVSLVWLYLEILRLLSFLQGDD